MFQISYITKSIYNTTSHLLNICLRTPNITKIQKEDGVAGDRTKCPHKLLSFVISNFRSRFWLALRLVSRSSYQKRFAMGWPIPCISKQLSGAKESSGNACLTKLTRSSDLSWWMGATWSNDQTFSQSNQPGEANSHGQLPRLIKYILPAKQNHLVKNI